MLVSPALTQCAGGTTPHAQSEVVRPQLPWRLTARFRPCSPLGSPLGALVVALWSVVVAKTPHPQAWPPEVLAQARPERMPLRMPLRRAYVDANGTAP